MWVLRNILVVLLVCFLFLTVACSKENPESKEEINKKTKEENVVEEEENSSIETTKIEVDKIVSTDDLEDLKSQPAGTLVSELSLEDELSTETNQIMENLNTDLREQLVQLTSKTQEPNAIESALIHLLGSPNYKEAIEIAEAFQPDFEEPYLPNPKRVGDSGNSEDIGKAIILLDASSSMLLSVNGEVKMDIAKDAVKRFADVIGQESEVSLVVYGHKGSESNNDKKLSCESIEEIYPMSEYNSEGFEESLATFESKGWTPLAGAINKAAEMSSTLDGPLTVYIVSDGVETCDGDPVKAAESFVEENNERSVNIIGFNVDQKAEEQLIAVSEAGNGKYFSANNAEEMQETIEYEWLPSLIDLAWAFQKAPGPWEILAEYDLYKVEHQRIRNLIDLERERFNLAIDIIRTEEMVPSEVTQEVSNQISTRNSKKIDIINELQTMKIDEIDAISDEIRERVDEWVEEMKELVYD